MWRANHTIPDSQTTTLTQSSRLWTSCSTKLKPRSIRNPHNLPPYTLPFEAQNRLRDRLSPFPESSQTHLYLLDLMQQTRIVHAPKDVACQLKRAVVILPLRLLEADVPSRHRDERVAVRLRHRDMGVVFRGVDMDVMRLLVSLMRGDTAHQGHAAGRGESRGGSRGLAFFKYGGEAAEAGAFSRVGGPTVR
jgi:hypothetical protein